jgi:hypothetical protein
MAVKRLPFHSLVALVLLLVPAYAPGQTPLAGTPDYPTPRMAPDRPVIGAPAAEAQVFSTDFVEWDKNQQSGKGQAEGDPPDLTLWNFFSAGWDEEFTRRESEGRAPDLALLRVQTNFMEREFRTNYFFQNNIHSKTNKNLTDLDAFLAYAFNRRFMLEVFANYQWLDTRTGHDLDGAAARLVGRVQLISTADSSYTFNFQVTAPNRGTGEHQTTFSYGMAGFEDLTKLGLYRVGLYGSFLFDSFAGPHAPGARLNDVQYDITIAKTWTDPRTPLIGNFTTFVENFAQTDLDGNNSGHTLVTITPGIRFNLGKLPGIKLGLDNWLMGGVDIPVSGPKPWDATYRFTYIKNF